MLGLFAFWLILAVFSFLATWWLRGKLGGNTPAVKSPPPTGKLIQFHIGGKDIQFLLNKEFFVRLAFLVLGPVAILSLSVSYAQLLPLRATFTLFVLPAYLIMLVLGFFFPQWGKRALLGFTAGMFATVLYDFARLAIVVIFGLGDPIQHIAILLLGTDLAGDGAFWWLGYLWRLFGNGAGIGIAYAMLPRWFHNVRGGLVFGTVVGIGMLAVLFFFPISQLHLFILSPFVVVTGFIGHWVYGSTLGWIFKRAKPAQSLPDNAPGKEKPLTWSK
jgi:hypothetical protein